MTWLEVFASVLANTWQQTMGKIELVNQLLAEMEKSEPKNREGVG